MAKRMMGGDKTSKQEIYILIVITNNEMTIEIINFLENFMLNFIQLYTKYPLIVIFLIIN